MTMNNSLYSNNSFLLWASKVFLSVLIFVQINWSKIRFKCISNIKMSMNKNWTSLPFK